MPLPSGVQNDLDAAVQRTGWTPQLITASFRLSMLVSLSPDIVEAVFKELLDKES